jgi:lysophospholipid acyltransferase (LPLAT)-like uncharacterized protein
VKNKFFRIALAFIVMLYLRFVFLTARWKIVDPQGIPLLNFNYQSTIILAWHNRIGIAPFFLRRIKNLYALASSHRDGMIIAWVLKFFSAKIIAGSTNRDAMSALKNIIKTLKEGGNVGISPDGPRGPVYKINSNLVSAAKLSNASIIMVGVYITSYVELKSWDKFIFPLPFARGVIVVDYPRSIDKDIDIEQANISLEERLNLLNKIAENLAKA